MKKFLAATLVLSSIAFVTPTAFAKGSLAVGHGGAYGWAVNMNSYGESDADALEHCSGECKIVYRFENTCAAFAKDGPGGATGWAHAGNREAAEKLAHEECLSEGGRACPIVVWGCDNR